MKIRILLLVCNVLVSVASIAAPSATPHVIPGNRVTSIFIAQDFINELMSRHAKSETLRDLTLKLDPDANEVLIQGVIHIPVEELRAINIDPKLGRFQFQLAIRLSTTPEGYLILDFPLNETYFYPAGSKDPKHERVIVPVQMLSLALASIRGYLAALSGDFGGFDRREAKLKELLRGVEHSLEVIKNQDARDDLATERDALKLKLEAIPVERKELQNLSKEYAGILGFTGEKELNLNDQLVAQKNALIIKLRLSQLAPFLRDAELGGVRLVHDSKDGSGQNYLVVDINAKLAVDQPVTVAANTHRPAMKIPPSIVLRLNQSIFETQSLVEAERVKIGNKVKDLKLELKEDGLHVSGRVRGFLFFSVGFETSVSFVPVMTDQFEVRVRKLDVAGIDFEFLSKYVLSVVKSRLDLALKGICSFEEIENKDDPSHALRVTIQQRALMPAFPDLHLIGVETRDREFLMRLGRE